MSRAVKAISLFLGAVVSLYLVLTWFFFGTPHPCGVVVALMRYEESRRTPDDRATEEKFLDGLRAEWLKINETIDRTGTMLAKAEMEGRTKDKMALLEALFRLTQQRASIEAVLEVLSDPNAMIEEARKRMSPAECSAASVGHIKRIWFSGDKQNAN